MPEKKFSKLHFFRQKLSATSCLSLRGKVDKAKLWTNEGQPNNNQEFSLQKAALSSTRILGFPLGGRLLAKQGGEGQPNNNQAFSCQKAALFSTRVLGFPVGEAVGFCRLKRSFFIFPSLPLASSCLRTMRQKLSAASRLPLGGKLLAKQGDEGRPNNNQAFSLQKAALYSTRIPGFRRLKRSLHAFPP